MSTPTLYFPDYAMRFGFTRTRKWNTVIESSPNGRTQKSPRWLNPKRGLRGEVWSTDLTALQVITDFLTTVKGMAVRYNIFPKDYQNFSKYQFYVGTGVPTFPLVLPFKRVTSPPQLRASHMPHVYIDNVATFVEAAFGIDDGGPGGEMRLTSLSGSVAAGSHTWTADLTDVRERIPVINASDDELYSFDFNAADPPRIIALSVIEDWG